MTKETVDIMRSLSKELEHSQGDRMLEFLKMALAAVMEREVGVLCGAEYGERSEERVNSRNGYRPRALETRLSSVELCVPKLRQGGYLPSFLEPRRRWEKAFANVVCEAYVLGVSTRKVEDLVEAMGARGMSKSEVSRLAVELDSQVEEFRNRPLDKGFPYLWLDAVYVKVREGGRVVSKAVLVAHGVSESGEREALGLRVADGEMEEAWRSFLQSLVERGLRDVRLVISDAYSAVRARHGCARTF